MDKASFSVDEMHCGNCVKHVTAALNALPGVKAERVSIGSAEVLFDPAGSSVAAIAEALGKAGYPARPIPAGGEPSTSR